MNALRAVSIVAPLLAAIFPYIAFAADPTPDAKQCAASEGAPARAVTQKEVDAEKKA